jgi:putative transposase
MANQRKQRSGKFKFEVALAAAKGDQTINQLASEHGLHPSQVSQWKRHLLDTGATLFNTNGDRQQREQAARETELYAQIGRLKMELEWLKKKAAPLA